MSDLFSNLVALSLGSIVGVQPLVPPLFAPAPQLLTETTPPDFNDQVAGTAESTVFSMTPQIVADGTGTPGMEQPSDEVGTPKRHTMFADPVHPDIPQSTIGIYPHVNSSEDDASRSLSVYRLPGKADGAPMPQDIQPQEATLPKTGNPEIISSSILQEVQKHSAAKTFPAPPGYSEMQQASPKDHPSLPIVDAFLEQKLSTPSDKVLAPLPTQPALQVSIASLVQDDLSEQRVSSDDVLDKIPALLQPHIQSPGIPVHMERFIAPGPDVAESVSDASRSKRRAKVDEWSEAPPQQLRGLDEHTIKPLLNQNAVAREQEELQSPSGVSTHEGIAQSTKARLGVPVDSEFFHQIYPAHLSYTQDTLHSSLAGAKLEAYGTKADSEVFPVNITIGRVVVRATQPAQPMPNKKRVIRPAQSLDEYLKQRERGSR